MKTGLRSQKEVILVAKSPVEVKIRQRTVTVKGKRGEITKNLKHLPVETRILKQNTKKRKGLYFNVKMYNASKKQACAVATGASIVRNMITGVTIGYQYKMRLVHAHFPINALIPKDGSVIEIKNFLGGKKVHRVDMLGGTTCKMSPELKDEVIFQGIDNQLLSLTCAQVNQSCNVGNKDERKFLDGVFVSEKGHLE